MKILAIDEKVPMFRHKGYPLTLAQTVDISNRVQMVYFGYRDEEERAKARQTDYLCMVATRALQQAAKGKRYR
jgi:hypothetical protein